MSKKKAIKVAAATAIAASAFAAVAPTQSEAATSASQVKSAVEYAKYKMWLPYKEFSKTASASEPVYASKVKSLIASAKAEKAKAQTLLNGYKGSDKAKLQETLNANDKFIANAEEYIKARYAGDDLLGKHDWDTVVSNALAGDLSKNSDKYNEIKELNNLYFDFDKEINAARKQIGKVWGAGTKEALKEYFTEPAYTDHASLVKDAAWAVHFAEKAEWWLTTGKTDADFLKNAEAHLANADKNLAKVDATSELGKLVSTYVAEVKAAYEAANTPKVESVSAINLKEIVVTFSKELDKASAEKASNYVLPGNSVSAKLQSDNKTVVLTVNNTLSNNTNYELSIKDVKTTGDKVVADTKQAFTAVDTNVPTVVSAVATSYKTVEVTFSEPVATVVAGDFVLGDAAGTVPSSVTFTANTNKVTLNFTAPLTVGEHSVKVNVAGNIKDLAGYVLPTASHKFDVVVDSVAPVAESVEINGRTEAVVKFNKPVVEADVLAAATNFKFGTTNDYNAATSKAADSVTKVDAQTYKVSFTTNPLPVGEGYLFVPAGIDDLNGNAVAAKSFKKTVVADVLPTLESVTSPAPNVIEVQFNKDVKAGSAVTKSFYTLKNSAGTTVSLTSANFAYDATNHVVTISNASLTDSSYSLTVKGVEDAVGEKVAETTKTFEVKETSAPQTTGVRWLDEADGAGKDVVIVTFDDKLATSGNYSVLNKAKWTFAGAALPTGSSLEINPKNEKEVIVHLNANAASTNVIAVNNVADAKGNIQTLSQSETLSTAQAGLAVSTATSVKLKDAKTIEFKLPRQLSSIDASDFVVRDVSNANAVVTNGTDNSISSLTYQNTSSGSTVTLVVAKDLDLTHSFDVATKATVNYTKDSDGLVLGVSSDTATAASEVQSGLKSAYVTSTTTVDVVVNQPLSALVNAADFRVVSGDKVITPVSASKNGNVVTLTLAAGDALTTVATPVVKTVSQDLIQTETDNGVKIVANTTGLTAGNFRATAVSFENADAGTVGTLDNEDVIKITFNNAVDAASLGFVSGDKQSDGSYLTTDGAVTFANAAAADDTITIAQDLTTIGELTVSEVAGQEALTDGDAVADLTLSADGKTLTVKITDKDTAAIANANYVKSTFAIDATVNDTDKNEANTSFAPATTTRP